MTVSEQLQALNDFDLADLDMDNIGRWPLMLKVIVLTLLYLLILFGGFHLHVDDLNKQLGRVEQEEQTLRQDFEKKAFEAANLAGLQGAAGRDGTALWGANGAAPVGDRSAWFARGYYRQRRT